MIIIKKRTISLIIILLMILGSFGAVGVYLKNNNDFMVKEFVKGEVLVGFYTELENLDPIDVKEIESFEGYNIKDKIEVLNVAVIAVHNGEEQTFIDNIITKL